VERSADPDGVRGHQDGRQDEPDPEAAILDRRLKDERQQAPAASDAWGGARRDALRAVGLRGHRCPAFAVAGAGIWAGQVPDVPGPADWFRRPEKRDQRRMAQARRDAAEPCTQGAVQSAEQSFSAPAAGARQVLQAAEQQVQPVPPAVVALLVPQLSDAAEPAWGRAEEQPRQAAQVDASPEALAEEPAEAAPEPYRPVCPSAE
jgi:hypothetical protein